MVTFTFPINSENVGKRDLLGLEGKGIYVIVETGETGQHIYYRRTFLCACQTCDNEENSYVVDFHSYLPYVGE